MSFSWNQQASSQPQFNSGQMQFPSFQGQANQNTEQTSFNWQPTPSQPTSSSPFIFGSQSFQPSSLQTNFQNANAQVSQPAAFAFQPQIQFNGLGSVDSLPPTPFSFNSQKNLSQSPEHVMIDASTLFLDPGRESRPTHMVIILRGPAGSGKSKLARLLANLEEEAGSNGTRIHCLEDHFQGENGFTYDPSLDHHYRVALFSSFSTSISQPESCSLVIVDAVNLKLEHYENFYHAAAYAGYTPFVATVGNMDTSSLVVPGDMNVLDMSYFTDSGDDGADMGAEMDDGPCIRPPSPPVKSVKYALTETTHMVDPWEDEAALDESNEMRDGRSSEGQEAQRKRVRWCDEAPDGSIPVSAGPGLEDVVAVEEDSPPYELGAQQSPSTSSPSSQAPSRRRALSDPTKPTSDLSVHFEMRRKVVVKGLFANSSPTEASSQVESDVSGDDGEESSFAQRVRQEKCRYREVLRSLSHAHDDDETIEFGVFVL